MRKIDMAKRAIVGIILLIAMFLPNSAIAQQKRSSGKAAMKRAAGYRQSSMTPTLPHQYDYIQLASVVAEHPVYTYGDVPAFIVKLIGPRRYVPPTMPGGAPSPPPTDIQIRILRLSGHGGVTNVYQMTAPIAAGQDHKRFKYTERTLRAGGYVVVAFQSDDPHAVKHVTTSFRIVPSQTKVVRPKKVRPRVHGSVYTPIFGVTGALDVLGDTPVYNDNFRGHAFRSSAQTASYPKNEFISGQLEMTADTDDDWDNDLGYIPINVYVSQLVDGSYIHKTTTTVHMPINGDLIWTVKYEITNGLTPGPYYLSAERVHDDPVHPLGETGKSPITVTAAVPH